MEVFSQVIKYSLLAIILIAYLIVMKKIWFPIIKNYFNKVQQPSADVINFFDDSLEKGEFLNEEILRISTAAVLNSTTYYENEKIISALIALSNTERDKLRKHSPTHYNDDFKFIYDLEFKSNGIGNYIFINGKNLSKFEDINAIYISSSNTHRFDIDDINIPTLYIHSTCSSINVKISNSNIGTLIIEGNSKVKHHTRNIIINSSNIGTLSLKEFCIHSLSMKGGSILNIECPNVNEDTPFIGDVTFENVFFPNKNMHASDRFTIQGYRNMQHHLQNLQNTLASNLFHTLELRSERISETKTNKIISYLYDWFSEYGSSISKPLVWLFCFWILSVTIFYLTDGLSTLDQKTNLYVGWRTVFNESGLWGMLSKSMYQSLINIVNPLSIFGVKSLLIPKYGLLTAWSIIHSLFSVIFVTLTLFAIRRRFKLQ